MMVVASSSNHHDMVNVTVEMVRRNRGLPRKRLPAVSTNQSFGRMWLSRTTEPLWTSTPGTGC